MHAYIHTFLHEYIRAGMHTYTGYRLQPSFFPQAGQDGAGSTNSSGNATSNPSTTAALGAADSTSTPTTVASTTSSPGLRTESGSQNEFVAKTLLKTRSSGVSPYGWMLTHAACCIFVLGGWRRVDQLQ